MEYRILGALEIVENGTMIEVGGARAQTLLAILLLRRGEVIPSEVLIEELYARRPPPTAAKSLQAHVSRLRKALGGAQRLQTVGRGYRLNVAKDELDADRFVALIEEGRRLVDRSDPASALSAFEAALGLWRGPPFGDLGYEDFAQAERSRLEELRLACVEERIGARLRLGLHAETVGDLETLTREHPTRESFRGQLMLALYRCGRQAEALDAYQDGRRRLVEEVGVEPGHRLRKLHRAILEQDPALDLNEETALQVEPPPVLADGGETAAEPRVAAPPDSTRKTITALGVVLAVSSSGDGLLDPEALRRTVDSAAHEIRQSVEIHGGAIETVTADLVVCVFGLASLHEDDALRALIAAFDAREALARLSAALATDGALRLEFGIGLSTGEVVIDRVPTGTRAMGEPLVRCQPLSQRALGGEVVIDEITYLLTRDAVVAEPLDGAWRVASVGDTPDRRTKRPTSPMVGRTRERRRILDAFDQAIDDRSCQLFTVLGTAGIGKSRLVAEVVSDMSGRALVARGRCLPYGDGITFWPLLEAVKEVVGLADEDSLEETRSKLAAVLADEPDAETIAQRITEIVGMAEIATGIDEGPVATAIRTLFEAAARRRPLVLVFDDIHWAEPTFLDLVEHVAGTARDAPILLLCIARPELLDSRPGWGGGMLNTTSALLEPLSDEEAARLLEHLVGPAQLVEAVRTRIAEAADGIPLFLEEVVSMLIDDGRLVSSDGSWAAAEDIADIRVPPTIQALLAARLDRLEDSERAVVVRAALIGKVFYEGAVAYLSDEHHRPTNHDGLASLVRKDLIRPDRPSLGERTYRFRHLLIRDAAYDSTPKELRADLHERFAEWLEEAARDRTAEYEDVIGYHLEQAHRYAVELGRVDDHTRSVGRAAARRLGTAGRRALVRSDAAAAEKLLTRATSLLRADDPLRLELLPNVRSMQGRGDFAWVDSILTDAVEAAATTGDRRLAANALVQRGFLRLFTDQPVTPAELIAVAERSIAVFSELDDHVALARSWRLIAQAHYLDRSLRRCAEASEQAYAHIRLTDETLERREIVEWLVIAILLGPIPAPDALGRLQRLIPETSDDAVLEAMIRGAMALLFVMQNRDADADAAIDSATSAMDAAGEWIWIVAYWLSLVYLWRGDPVTAEQQLRPGYEALRKIGERSSFSSLAHGLMEAAYAQGRYEESYDLGLESEFASRPNDVQSKIIVRSVQAKILARRGEHEAAAQLSAEALELASSSDLYLGHALALMDRAEIARLAGDNVAATAAIDKAVEYHHRKGNLYLAERAMALRPAD